ncbi:MAG: carboxypeptidase-like regulatory domain-containing protein [Acidobacteriaceae bacterium]|nr:carboxypeptidase-like regulatory domain-containing protein [Acidobacteriaceae bacterium]
MSFFRFSCLCGILFVVAGASGSARAQQQLPSAPSSQLATRISGYTVDPDQAAIPHASITADGPTKADHFVATGDDSGYFTLNGLVPGTTYTITISAAGFKTASLQPTTLTSGQSISLPATVLVPSISTEVDAISPLEAATLAVHEEEKQRVLGIIPNFFVSYGNLPYVPLTTKLKFELTGRALIDPFTWGAAAFSAGINQAGDRPGYRQGAKGYLQRFGAGYTDGATDLLLGGAVLPTLLHQDPRYFVQGTGTKKSRLKHAMSSPFICKGDNGKWQFNASSIGGDILSGSLSNIYYPPSDRGVGLVFGTAAVLTGARVVSATLQEFVLAKYTSGHHAH